MSGTETQIYREEFCRAKVLKAKKKLMVCIFFLDGNYTSLPKRKWYPKSVIMYCTGQASCKGPDSISFMPI